VNLFHVSREASIHTLPLFSQAFKLLFENMMELMPMGWIQDTAVVKLLLQTAHALRVELLFFIGILIVYATTQRARRPPCKAAKLPPRHTMRTTERASHKITSSARAAHPLVDSSTDVPAKDLDLLIQGTADAASLKDPAWLLPRLMQLIARQPKAGFAVYRRAVKAGLDLSAIHAQDRDSLIIQAASAGLRQGMTSEVKSIINDFVVQGLVLSPSVHASVVKLFTAKQCFRECLEMHDMATRSPGFRGELDKTVWSCLIFCAVEDKRHDKSTHFFEELKKCGEPTPKDYWNLVRMSSFKADYLHMLKLIKEMQERGMTIDGIVYSTTLATCVSADQVDIACALLDTMEEAVGVSDVITYNALIKGCAKNGKVDECFELYSRMRERGVTPSAITFGILLDACINDTQCERAAEVFESMRKEGCPMNTVLCTTLIKGFAREGRVDEVMRVYRQMVADQNSQPDLITFSVLMKSNCDAGRMEDAMDLLETMLEKGLRPDEGIFNSLFSGCAKRSNVPLAQQLYKDMLACCIWPSSLTFSILVRLYLDCKQFSCAIALLRCDPPKYNVDIEPRLYAQLLQACIRARQGKLALEVYTLMAERSTPSLGLHSSLLATCVKTNMFDTGVELLEAIAAKRGCIEARDAQSLFEGLEKKQKSQLMENCIAAMRKLGIDAPPRRSRQS
jgi:pentatricopeptide repeat protein